MNLEFSLKQIKKGDKWEAPKSLAGLAFTHSQALLEIGYLNKNMGEHREALRRGLARPLGH